jgi:hypothetical protein
MILITVKEKVGATPSQIKQTLLKHEQLDRFFNANFSLIKKQNEGEIKGGKGSVRQVSMIGIQFEEQIISADNNHISYQIVGNKPVADHRGDIFFCSDKGSVTPITEITYNINFKPVWWQPSFILVFFIKKDITQALKKLAIHFESDSV